MKTIVLLSCLILSTSARANHAVNGVARGVQKGVVSLRQQETYFTSSNVNTDPEEARFESFEKSFNAGSAADKETFTAGKDLRGKGCTRFDEENQKYDDVGQSSVAITYNDLSKDEGKKYGLVMGFGTDELTADDISELRKGTLKKHVDQEGKLDHIASFDPKQPTRKGSDGKESLYFTRSLNAKGGLRSSGSSSHWKDFEIRKGRLNGDKSYVVKITEYYTTKAVGGTTTTKSVVYCHITAP